jgi:hypothetical protein
MPILEEILSFFLKAHIHSIAQVEKNAFKAGKASQISSRWLSHSVYRFLFVF